MKPAINECMTPKEVILWLMSQQVDARVLTADAASAMARLRFLLDERNSAQHEATWAMAMLEADKWCSNYGEPAIGGSLLTIPCPPLQTNNEK